MKIAVCGHVVETKDIVKIEDVEYNKRMFLNRDAGFILFMANGERITFSERIPFETTNCGIYSIKSKWDDLRKKVEQEWEKDKCEITNFEP